MPAEEAPANRLGKFKYNTKCQDARRRRNEVSVELRKANRTDQLLKRRNITNDENELSNSLNDSALSPITMTIDEIADGLRSDDEETVFQAAQTCRKILSRQVHPPIDDFIDKGIIPHLVSLLSCHENQALQFESAWALTNIASGTSQQTQIVIDHGAIPKFIELLKSPYVNVVEQSIWALGNIAGDGPGPRDAILNSNVMPPLLSLITPSATIPFVRNCIWAISNLCRNKYPSAPFEIVSTAIPTLYHVLSTYRDEIILSDTCWALSYLTDASNNQIEAVISSGVVPHLITLLASPRHVLLAPALRTVGNIVTGNDHQTDTIIAAGALPILRLLMLSDRVNIVKEACWAISNICAGNSAQIQAVIDADILPPLIYILEKGDFKAQKEAVWAITNMTTAATTEQLVKLVQVGILTPFCNLLESKDAKTVGVVLDGLKNMLNGAMAIGAADDLTIMIEECGGLDKLENIQHHENDNVYRKAVDIIDTFFAEEDSNAGLAPEANDGEFEFQPESTQNSFHF